MTGVTMSMDGIQGMVPREQMCDAAKLLRNTYAITPGEPFIQREFGFYCLERWAEQGMPQDVPRDELFEYSSRGGVSLGGLGWCEAAFSPAFEERVLEDRGEHELVQDFAGRHVLCFKGRRSGFMPEYVDHPVKDMKTWVEDCKWRLDPTSLERYADLDANMEKRKPAIAEGMMVVQGMVGGYMYLRSLIGPGDLLYKFYDEPELIHDCMQTWLELAQSVIARHQEHVTIDELFLAEDICYNHGLLISPDMMREFLFPYYQELIISIKDRQLDKNRHLYLQIDTDGWAVPTIPVYQELGMDVMSPFEVASGCDVVAIGKQYPGLVLTGGLDKRTLAESKDAIDKMVDRIFPAMQARGGYIPTCDHGVPEEVPYENYLHYRKRALEFA
ncbi:MAG: uroporphyrinogen decarboxylase family protein [Kiritimatiellia bacterium]|jgi:uroporphyrinogen decarboxylase|nr:uroporphyrinogen decarboxylase family protein [Kiritimatiellia bacterium]